MAISSIITRGFGNTIALVVTRGYGLGTPTPPHGSGGGGGRAGMQVLHDWQTPRERREQDVLKLNRERDKEKQAEKDHRRNRRESDILMLLAMLTDEDF